MHLTRRKAVVLLAVAFVACSDGTAPKAPSTGFFLSDINGRILPTYVVPGDPTTTVVSGWLTLDGIGHATMVEERRQQDGTPLVLSTAYNYRINGSDVVFSFQVACPINADCIAPPHGTISPVTGRLALEIGQFDTTPIVYNFARVMLD